ncbi:MAG TPA: glycosyltransferase [Solirubrobacteraceae bacterium]|nr:glycosyltransferase [Solirubrobacteraceae bacterium]
MTQGSPAGSGLPTVSVVVPTYERREQLPGLIDPILADPATTELIVVVDGSADGSIELLRERARSAPALVPVLIENRGEAEARLEGVRRARGELIVLLDDDVVPAPRLVSAHAARHAGADDLLVVGAMPVLESRSAAVRHYASAYEAHVARWRSGSQSVIRTLWAGNLSLRREAYLRIAAGPTGSRYDYHADRVFGLQCEAAGLRAVFEPACAAVHHYERTLAGLARDARRQGAALVLLAREHPRRAAPLHRDAFTRHLPGWLAGLVELARRPRADALLRTGARIAAQALDRARADSAVKAADLLAILERQRGAIEASR